MSKGMAEPTGCMPWTVCPKYSTISYSKEGLLLYMEDKVIH